MKSTLTEFLLRLIQDYGLEKNIVFTKEDDEYIPFKLKDLIRNISCLISYFESCNLEKNDKVAIFSESRAEWVSVDFACMFYKAVSVPIYTSVSDSQIQFILENSESKICFVSNLFLLDKILKLKNNLPKLKDIVLFNYNLPDSDEVQFVKKFSDIPGSVSGKHLAEIPEQLKSLSAEISDEDLITIIYTSGTTGVPKGVMLSHKNIFSNIKACQKVLPITDKDRFLSYLPYSHIYERCAGYYLPLYCGAEIYYAQNIDSISVQMPEVKPTFIITVPRLLDKIFNKLMKSSESMNNGLRKKLFDWAVNIAKAGVSKDTFKWKIADKLVYKKIREKTGGQVRYFISGGGALNKSIGEFFENIGITTLEGYGLTETSPVISVNIPGNNRYGTVGKILDGVEVRFSEENEILVKGDLVMKGYYRDENATREIMHDSWLHTGDIGCLDNDGFLKITDRKKSMFKTSGGKYIAPAQIEEIVSSLEYIENIVVIGNERMYVTALIVPLENELIIYAKKNNIKFDSYTELISDKKLHMIIQKDLDKKQKDLAHFERVRRFVLLENPFSIESGELTPTLKVKRKFVEEKFKDEIEEMYLKI